MKMLSKGYIMSKCNQEVYLIKKEKRLQKRFSFVTKGLLYLVKLLQNKKGPKNLGYPRKNSPFISKKTAFFSGTPNFFGPSYFEAALDSVKN